MVKASLSPIISTSGLRTYIRGAFGLAPPPSGLVLEALRAVSAAARSAVGFVHELCDPTLQQRAKFVFAEPGVADDAAHGERVHRVVSGNRDDPDIVGHDDVLALPGDPKARLLQSAYGVLMVDARYP